VFSLAGTTLTLALTVLAPGSGGPASAPTPCGPATQVIRVSSHAGFNWGDAAIGAAGGIGVVSLAVGAALLSPGGRRAYRPDRPQLTHQEET
jgi:hypothetical protein